MENVDNRNVKTTEKIGQALLDYRFYSGNDQYSDGDIEEELLAMTRCQDFSEIEILAKDHRWPLLSHLSPQRRNLLEWYDFSPNASILEIGAGCGALTGLLCEKTAKVTAVELSRKRAEITARRCQKHANLHIMVGNLNEMHFEEKFDYITLIGVLEYAAKFTESSQPYEDFLKKISRFLAPQGTLILAIENKFGLKYWAGAREDHTRGFFEGLEGYPNSSGIATFGKNELTDLLQRVGFHSLEYYYPVPDYKMPKTVYSQYCLPQEGQLDACAPNYDQDRLVLFREDMAYDHLIRNQNFEFFANSFLIFAKVEDCYENTVR